MRIAIIGPFDIENYGDHLLKEVLEYHIQQQFGEVQLEVFTVQGGQLGFRQRPAETYPIDSLEAMHKQNPYDTLIVAGGSVIHYKTLLQNLRGEAIVYPIWKLWAQASRVASKYGVRLLWNSPEAPHNFDGWETLTTSPLLAPVDYISVRNQSSYRALAPYSHENPVLTPDSAWALRTVYTDEELLRSLPSELKGAESLVLFHCNQRLDEADIPRIITLLTSLKQKGHTVILLPLAYTNNEQALLKKLNEQSGNSFIFIDRTLPLVETIALFSRAVLYIGLSFHGAITASVFGSEVVAFDYEKRRKTKELYDLMEKSAHYTTDSTTLESVIEQLISSPLKKSEGSALVRGLQQQVSQHFSHLTSTLQKPHYTEPVDIDSIYAVAEHEVEKRFKQSQELQTLSDEFKRCYDLYQDLLAKTSKL